MTVTTSAEHEAAAGRSGGLRRAVVVMSASSFLVPAAGLLTQPILARALGTDGRGELAAAVAPAALVGSVATLGLPDAVTYLVAKNPHLTRRALGWASGLSAGLGVVCVLVAWAVLPFLSGGDAALGRYILVATGLALPILVVGALRGAAVGRQMWRAVGLEGLITATVRIVAFAVLWASGHLTPLVAVLVTMLVPVLSGLVAYAPLMRRMPPDDRPRRPRNAAKRLLSFGSRAWFGSVASMFMAKTDQVLMAPLAGVRDLGLYTVANTVTDVPLVVVLAVSGALQGVNSKVGDRHQVASTTRLTLMLAFLGCGALAATCPLWITPIFGAAFADAVLPTIMLFGGALVCVPGLVAGAGLASAGRPGLRSIGLGSTCVVNVVTFVTLVPAFGVIGACWTSLISGTVLSGYMVVTCSRVMRLPIHLFLVPRRADVLFAWWQGRRMIGSVLARVPRPA